MRKRKYVVAGLATVALSLAFSSIAHAITFQNQQLAVQASAPKLDKKKPGAITSFTTDVITNYDVSGPPSAPDRFAQNTKVYFPTDYIFNATGLSQCQNSAAFAAGNQANAIALCGAAQVSSAGSATLAGAAPGVTAKVTAFNGVPSGGQPTILLHSESSAGANLVLVGTLKPSDTAGYGKMLDVPVDLGPFQGVEAITDFKVTIKKVKLPAKGKAASSAKKKKKKKAAPKYYIMAKCSKKSWSYRAVSTYNTGAPTTADAPAVACKQAKAKKKKKKK